MSTNQNVDISGVLANLNAAVEDIIAAAMEGAFEAGEHIGNESDDLTPIDTGALVQSRRVTQDEARRLTAVSYNVPYAQDVHENQNAVHPHGGEAKFLSKAMESEADQAAQIIQAKIVQALS